MIRKSAIRRAPIKRKGRSASEYARIYHSKKRVLFVKSLPCQMCFVVGRSVNAHVGGNGKGMGRKANYDQIAAMCGKCHYAYDNSEAPYERDGSHGEWNRMLVLCAADRTQRLWLEHIECLKTN